MQDKTRWQDKYPDVAQRIEWLQIDLRKFEDGLQAAIHALEREDPPGAWQMFGLTDYPLSRLPDHYRKLMDELKAVGGGPPQEGGER